MCRYLLCKSGPQCCIPHRHIRDVNVRIMRRRLSLNTLIQQPLVVEHPLRFVAENTVGLADLLEPLLMENFDFLHGGRVSVRMVDHGGFPVRFLDLRLGCLLLHAQQLVEVRRFRLIVLGLTQRDILMFPFKIWQVLIFIFFNRKVVININLGSLVSLKNCL